jgi:L-amino acid N-acyltransferase YncA
MAEYKILFEDMSSKHRDAVMKIYNYYIENSFSAYPDKILPVDFYNKILEMTKGFPAFVMKIDEKVVGFCFIRSHNPFPTFKETAEITYFIEKDYTGKGLGKAALDRLEAEAKNMGIKNILASISSENVQSISFHKKFGFNECGKFEGIGKKWNKHFDTIWMQKKI